MAAATFPRYGANLRNADGATLPDFQDRSMVTVGGVRIGLTGATYEDSPRASDPGDLKFSSSVTTLIEQARTLRREGADFVVAVAHVTREQGTELYRSDTIDLILTGHTHDLFINYDGNTAMVEFELRRPLRHRHRRRDRRQGGGRQAPGDLVAAVSRDRHRCCDAGPRDG